MINQASLEKVGEATFSENFCRPLYNSYCFSNIIGTIEHLLTGKSEKQLPIDVLENLSRDYDKVALIFVDALGWRFIEPRLETSSTIKKLVSNGNLSKLTSIFPSTTTAAVPCMNTGKEPVETELIEAKQYNPKVGDVIMPIKFTLGYNKKIDLAKEYNLEPENIYPVENIYSRLLKSGISSTCLVGDSYAGSRFNSTLMKGAEVLGYLTLTEAFYSLAERILEETDKKRFLYLYLNQVDEIAHKYGAGAKEVDLEIDNVLSLIDELVIQRTEGRAKKTLLLITADHGHEAFDPKETFYINQQIPDFEKYLAINSRGNRILPSGSARDVFLHINPEYLKEAKSELEQSLKGIAEVYFSKDLLEQGFFGRAEPSEDFKRIIGDIILLPYSGQSIWWYQGEDKLKQSKGQHGGLTRNEMEIPLFAYEL